MMMFRYVRGFRNAFSSRYLASQSFSLVPHTHTHTQTQTQQNQTFITTTSPVRVRKKIQPRSAAALTHTTNTAVELAFNSVVKIFTVSCSPNYLLPWQNKSQRESMGSGIFFFLPFLSFVFSHNNKFISNFNNIILQGL